MLKIILLFILTFLGGKFYRLGGTSVGTKFRDFGVPLIALVTMYIWGFNINWYMGILLFGTMFASLLSYYKKKGKPAIWWNWFLVGLGFGLSALPYTIYSGNWCGFILRTVILSIGVMVWCENVENPDWEEGGRGAMFILTLPLLLI